MPPFEPGTAIALREIWRGAVWAARPATVVLDGDLSMFHVPVGIRWIAACDDDGRLLRARRDRWRLGERTWEDHHVLSFAWPGVGHAVLLFFDRSWAATTWYVNVQDPLQRTRIGFDTMDHQLDVLVGLDLETTTWKDEDELREDVRLGNYTEDDAARFRAEGARGVERVVGREPPFDRDWSGWRPDPSWPAPILPSGWNRV